ncbi:MAG: 3-hydroxyacyl-ACP dehydratase FabZ family protein [Planctomycetota bacterium]|nr:3-hydroxyacyl-ACP dehydratase FabZ family protein [Planctomycetota bacterium]
MPPQPLMDVSKLDMNRLLVSKEEIYAVNPHRHEFARLDGILMIDRDAGLSAGYHDVRDDEFWVRGHIPGRPIFPGVMMIETAAQLVSYYVMSCWPDKGFLGFGAVDGVKFRGQVTPGQRIIMVGQMLENRPRRCVGYTQAFVEGTLVYEGKITGMWL